MFGRSLGGAVAIALAAEAPERLCGLVLENTFVSVAEMATHVLPIVRPFGPVLPYILKSKWESIKAVRTEQPPRVAAPLFFVAPTAAWTSPAHECLPTRFHASRSQSCSWLASLTSLCLMSTCSTSDSDVAWSLARLALALTLVCFASCHLVCNESDAYTTLPQLPTAGNGARSRRATTMTRS